MGDSLHHGTLKGRFLDGGRVRTTGSLVLVSTAAPHNFHLAPAVPGDAPVQGAALAAHHHGREGVFATVPTEWRFCFFRGRPFGNSFCQFLLSAVEDARLQNLGQTAGNVVFGQVAVVLDGVVGEQAGLVGLLQQHISLVLHIGEDGADSGDAPFL